jgi:hypothetical protein
MNHSIWIHSREAQEFFEVSSSKNKKDQLSNKDSERNVELIKKF